MSKANNKSNLLPANTASPTNKYAQPKAYSGDMGNTGYPNGIANTQTLRTRGTKNTSRGHSSSTKMG